MENEIYLFSYGTLQNPKIQKNLFGRTLIGKHDKLKGFELRSIRIPDEAEATEYPIIYISENNSEVINGVVFKIMKTEIYVVDEYEGEFYRRIQATLESGKSAMIYVAAN